MKKTSNKELLNEVVDNIGQNSIASLTLELGYSNASGLYKYVNGEANFENLPHSVISKIIAKYPQVNELFLKRKSEEVLLDLPMQIGQANLNVAYTQNDVPNLIAKLVELQEENNELLKQLVAQKST